MACRVLPIFRVPENRSNQKSPNHVPLSLADQDDCQHHAIWSGMPKMAAPERTLPQIDDDEGLLYNHELRLLLPKEDLHYPLTPYITGTESCKVVP